jgi:N-methylhydantoinase B
LFSAIAEEMGVILRKSSFSPNIKERRDFSCALFDASGNMIAQAAHIPVHLGSMPLSVTMAIRKYLDSSVNLEHPYSSINKPVKDTDLYPGDVIILNDPYSGGTHLPDITLISPVFITGSKVKHKLIGFVANRAHHSDIGGMTPGSMPIAREIYQEGLRIPPIKLFERWKLNQDILDLILSNVRTPRERYGDLLAQYAANYRGAERFIEMVVNYGENEIKEYMGQLLRYSEQMTRTLISDIPDGVYQYKDHLDNDGINSDPIPIHVAISIKGDQATVDFTGSAPQQSGGVNAVYAITLSCVHYVIRCLIDLDVPNNSGCIKPIKVIAPEGSIVNAFKPAPVAGGNVETSQRIVDVLFGALANAFPEKVPAASQGTMNNVSIGGWDVEKSRPFAYYETIGGGMGARPYADGLSAIHSHMTNTLNTPIEALEFSYPLRVLKYEIRKNSGGSGKYKGGDGIRRDVQMLVDCRISLLSERRVISPYGLRGGGDGKRGKNILIKGDQEIEISGKGTYEIATGEILSIRTPGGGGYGNPNV